MWGLSGTASLSFTPGFWRSSRSSSPRAPCPRSDEKLDRLIAAGRTLLNISFDGGTKETFEHLRRPAIFEEVIGNMRRLHERKRAAGSIFPLTNMISCLTRETLPETEEVVDIAGEAGVNTVLFQVATAYVESFRPSTLTADDHDAVTAAVERARVRARANGVKIHFHSQWDTARPEANGNGMYCPNIWQQMHIDMHGNPRFCCYWGQEDLGNVAETSATELWNSEKCVGLRRRFRAGDLPTLCTSMPCPNLRPHNRNEILDEAWRLAREFWR
jgi:MoaA/NifB/PqqE/SkfB family radical SAM enzyme